MGHTPKEDSEGKTPEAIARCKNCGAELQGAFCHLCGQNKREHHRTFGNLIREFSGDLFSVDSRLSKTLKLLILHPGELSRVYFQGFRASYLPPLRLYLIGSFLFFFISTLQPSQTSHVKIGEHQVKTNRVVYTFDEEESSFQQPSPLTQEKYAWGKTEPLSPESSNSNDIPLKMDKEAKGKIPSDHDLGNRFAQKLEKAISNKESLLKGFFSAFPKLFFILVPFSALLLKLYFRKSSLYYIEMLIFSLHFHTFCFLIMSASTFLEMALRPISPMTAELSALPFLVWNLFYFYKALKLNFYGSRFWILFGMFAMGILYFILLLILFLGGGMLYIWFNY